MEKSILNRTGEFDFESEEARLAWINQHPIKDMVIPFREKKNEGEDKKKRDKK